MLLVVAPVFQEYVPVEELAMMLALCEAQITNTEELTVRTGVEVTLIVVVTAFEQLPFVPVTV